MINTGIHISRIFVQTLILYHLIGTIFFDFTNTKVSLVKTIFAFSSLGISSYVMALFTTNYYDIYLFCSLFLVNKLILKESFKLSLASSVIISALYNICLCAFYNVASLFTNISIYSSLCLLCSAILLEILSIPIFIYIKKNSKKISLVLQETTIPLIVVTVIYTVMMRMLIFAKLNYSVIGVIFKFLFVICEVFSSFSFIYYFIETKYSKTQSEIAECNLNNTIDKLRIIKHDYDNILQSINGYIVTKQYDNLNAFIQNLVGETKAINYDTSLIENLNAQPALFGVISSKYHIALSKKIDFNIKINTNLNFISYNIASLSRIIGILLDNAIEATEKAASKKINVIISKDDNDSTFIQIENSVRDKNIDIESIFEKGVSSKKIKSGIGLWEVKKLVNSAPNSHIFTKVKDNIFSQTLVIDNV